MSGISPKEVIGLRQLGVMGNASGSVGTGTTAVTVPVPAGAAILVALRVDIFGVTQAGTVSYEIAWGTQAENGYANNDRIECWIASPGPLTLTIDNQQASAVVYNLLWVALTDDQYDVILRCLN